ncbi:MAG: hypothetical protein AB7O26_07835 [Planctomycetaceae bacterium]
MKSLLTHALAAVALAALLAVPAEAGTGIKTRPSGRAKSSESAAQGSVLNKDIIVAPNSSTSAADGPVRGKLPETDVIVDPATRPAQKSRTKDVIRAHRLFIRHFSASRTTGRIAIRANLSNLAQAVDENVNFTIMRMEAGRWVTVSTGKLDIPAGRSRDISAAMSPTNEAVRLKIDITATSPYMYDSKEFRLREIAAPSKHILAYGTNDWVLAYERKGNVDSGQLRAEEAHKRARQLAEFGFATRITTKTTTDFFKDTEHIHLWIRTPMQTREFDTVEEALAFARGMKSLIKDSVGVWSRVDP